MENKHRRGAVRIETAFREAQKKKRPAKSLLEEYVVLYTKKYTIKV